MKKFIYPDICKMFFTLFAKKISSIIAFIVSTVSTLIGFLRYLDPPFITRRKVAFTFLSFIIVYILSILSLNNYFMPKIKHWGITKRIIVIISCLFLSTISAILVDGIDFKENLRWLPEHQITITTNIEDNGHSDNSYIKLIGINYADEKSLSFSSLKLSDNWLRDETGLTTHNNNAMIYWKGHPGNKLIIFLEKSPNAGSAIITIDGEEREIDLFSKEKEILGFKKSFHSPAYLNSLNFVMKWIIFIFFWGFILVFFSSSSTLTDHSLKASPFHARENFATTLKFYFKNHGGTVASWIIIIIIGLITYGKAMSATYIYGDEWGRVYRSIHDSVTCPMPNNLFLRPLTGCYFKFLDLIFGTNVILFRSTAIILTIIAAISFYFFLQTVLKEKKAFSLIVALVFLVFPTTTVHSWFEIGYQKIGAIFFFISAKKLYEANNHNQIFQYLKFFPLFLLSILIYEANFGLAILFIFILIILSLKKKELSTIFANCGLLVGLILYSLGRLITQIQNPGFFGHSIDNQSNNIYLLLERLFNGFLVNQITIWSDSILFLSKHYNYKSLFLITILSIVIVFLALYYFLNLVGEKYYTQIWKSNLISITELIKMIIIGTTATLAGLIPMILSVEPGLGWIQSRMNYWPSFESSIVWVSFAGIIFVIIKNKKIALSTYFSIIALFLSISIMKQLSTQNQLISVWNDKKIVLEQLFELAPDIKSDTNVILIYTDPSPEIVGPFNSGIRAELTLFYNKPEFLNGYTLYAQSGDIETNSEGFIIKSQIIPFDNTIVFELSNGELKKLQEFAGYKLCNDCIIQKNNPNNLIYRDLLLK